MPLNFQGSPAFVMKCPVCTDRHVGGPPDVDEATSNWMEKHAKWHEHSQLAPPAGIVLPGR
jgi:hypothetical protein